VGVRALRHERIAVRYRLGRRGILAGILRNRHFPDADERFAVGAIEEVEKAGFAGDCHAFAGLAERPRLEVKKDRGHHHVVVPQVMVGHLVVPAILAGLVVDGDD
jgi:hypothetical protein